MNYDRVINVLSAIAAGQSLVHVFISPMSVPLVFMYDLTKIVTSLSRWNSQSMLYFRLPTNSPKTLAEKANFFRLAYS
jgi:hypothetical protein